MQVVLANDYTGPGSGLDGSYTSFNTGAAPSTTEQVRARSIGGLITHAELRAKARDRMGLPPEPARLP